MSAALFTYNYAVDNSLNENTIWRHDILPHVQELPQNVRQICQYGFTEMANNAIEHSGSKDLTVDVSVGERETGFDIIDSGVGIFFKVQKGLGLDDPRYSILELEKGKFTTAPQNHSGEGIFFTSKIFDCFSIRSGGLLFVGGRGRAHCLEELPEDAVSGTVVSMAMQKNSPLLIADVFNEYASPDTLPGFYKTTVPVKLLECDGDFLVSRSQAKQLTTRFDRFLEVVLDFSGVEMIGQGFADEVFRVFAEAHPNVSLRPIRCETNVANMIHHVTAR